MNQSSLYRGNSGKLLLPVALILTSFGIVGGVLGSNLLHKSAPIDNDTLCRRDVPLEYHTLLAIDATDAFTRGQVARLRASVSEERAALPKFGRLTLLFVTSNMPFEPEEVISLCNPGSGSEADLLMSNPNQI